MKIVTIVGARPQFIKAAAISRVINNTYLGEIDEVIVHTGQHFDSNMSKVFFDELSIPKPKYNLEISGGSHGQMTGRMLEAIENVLLQEAPDWILIYGDTNSTLAGALAASKLHIPIAHVEAGLRSFNVRMPEEINRIIADRISSLLFCPTDIAVKNLMSEGITKGVHNTGDVMYDVALRYKEIAEQKSTKRADLKLTNKGYALATCHRAENTDDPQKLFQILTALDTLSATFDVVFPLHPRTRKLVETNGFSNLLNRLIVTEPLPFLDMVALEQAAKLILTDSGGVQKEAFFYGVPCVTMRDETEWVETVELGWNRLAGANAKKIVDCCMQQNFAREKSDVYGRGTAASNIVSILLENSR